VFVAGSLGSTMGATSRLSPNMYWYRKAYLAQSIHHHSINHDITINAAVPCNAVNRQIDVFKVMENNAMVNAITHSRVVVLGKVVIQWMHKGHARVIGVSGVCVDVG
jgi:hypothetical protein